MNEARTAGDSRTQADICDDLMDIARLAYIYGLPCYEVARLRYRALSLPRKGGPLRPNTFLHTRALSTPATAVVTAVNSDTLLSRAWIDLSRGPLIIHLPDTADRYYSLALMDVFTNNFAVPGRRTTGTAAGRFLLAGPQWDGAAPAGMKAIRAPTNAVWALVRILVDGPGDVAAVHAIQDQFAISRWGAPSDAASWSRDPLSLPVQPLDNAKPLIFFDVLNAMLTENPPPARDGAVLDRLRAIGVGPSLRFSRQDFAPPQLEALRRGLASARDMIGAQAGFRTLAPQRAGFGHWPSDALLAQLRGPIDASRRPTPGDRRLGWSGPLGDVGNFGADYLLRAQCALAGLGLLPREEAMYFSTATDAIGAPLNGRNRYVLRFPPAGLPPVDAFWSLTIYQTDENNRRWLAPNPIDRYSLGSRKSDLRYGGDGSLEIFIQHVAPTGGEENWLPAPDAPFLLTLRAYQPRRALLEGRFSIPEVQRRSETE
ncbi:MAG: DUF1254 domain-containing protein [Roseiarcus sp.]|jgi:hypothetical protein